MVFITIDEECRVTGVTTYRPSGRCYDDEIAVELPAEIAEDLESIHEYLYVDGEFKYSPRPQPEVPEPEPTAEEIINALLGVE